MFRRLIDDEVPGFRPEPITARFWRVCALALLLLFAQHLAQTHALEHRPLDGLSATAGGDTADCPQCLALGGLQGGAMATALSAPPPVATDVSQKCLSSAEPSRRVSTAHAIRAPPENRDGLTG